MTTLLITVLVCTLLTFVGMACSALSLIPLRVLEKSDSYICMTIHDVLTTISSAIMRTAAPIALIAGSIVLAMELIVF